MSRVGRIAASTRAGWHSFLRRRTAVFFTFFFPLLIVVIFGVLVQTEAAGGGIFAESPAYYAPGYLAVVVLFTPLSRVGSEVARHREGNRFEKLATTPLQRWEWLAAQTLVNVVVIGIAALGVFALLVAVIGVTVAGPLALAVALLAAYVLVGVVLFCGVGAVIGSVAGSQDGVIAASNGIALPLLFLSETFVQPSLLPGWLPTGASPLTYFSRGVRATILDTAGSGALAPQFSNLLALCALALAALVVGAFALPRTD
jgi:ABC-2 type transport system permease protein